MIVGLENKQSWCIWSHIFAREAKENYEQYQDSQFQYRVWTWYLLIVKQEWWLLKTLLKMQIILTVIFTITCLP